MNDPEKFLSRWSRRKRAAEESAPDAAEDASAEASARPLPRWRAIASGQRGNLTDAAPDTRPEPGSSAWQRGDPELDSRLRGNERKVSVGSETAQDAAGHASTEGNKAAEPEFDISKLPPIESITAETDIRPFLAPGVPAALTQAALRRAWVIDPKIRDFIEVAENQWDFTAPGVPGFDLSPPTGDIKRMVAEIFGEKPAEESTPAKQLDAGDAERRPSPNVDSGSHQAGSDSAQPNDRASASVSSQETARQTLVAEHSADDAAQQNHASQNNKNAPNLKRTHGGALPR